jgi:NTP pyrophosphatase (non-canonical NTP hydrolase)
MKDKISKIAKHYRFETQLIQLGEENSELFEALSKYHRFENLKNTSTDDSNMLIQNIVEEIADVEIMLEQMKILLDISNEAVEGVKEKKVNRQLERIEQEGNK